MAEITWPQEAVVTNIESEIWYPGRIVHQNVSGDLSQYPITLGTPRLRGNAEVRLWSSFSDRPQVAVVEAFLNQFARPENTSLMPWGGDPPYRAIPQSDMVRTLTAVSGTNIRTFTLTTKSGTTRRAISVGDWLKSPTGRITQVVSVTAGSTADETLVTLEPDPAIGLGGPQLTQEFTPAATILVRTPTTTDETIRTMVNASFAGPWTISWQEVF